MHTVHIAGIDLNLAVVLHALLEERNVTRAAARVGLSQSATSHALARLRDLLKDPLFVRGAVVCAASNGSRWTAVELDELRSLSIAQLEP